MRRRRSWQCACPRAYLVCLALAATPSLAADASAPLSDPALSVPLYHARNVTVNSFSEDALQRGMLAARDFASDSAASFVSRSGQNTTGQGRYGHAAAYLPSGDQVLFVGGQVGTEGTVITNDVYVLELGQDSTASPSNELRADLPAGAWAASLVDSEETVWLVGGVTEDCYHDATAYVLEKNAKSWKAVEPYPSKPPRRRQAHAVAGWDNSGKNDAFYLFGGIAEPYTCSLETVAYLGMDVWSPAGSGEEGRDRVATAVWKAPKQIDKLEGKEGVLPPVSDYAAVGLKGKDGIAYLGGQDANGNLASLQTLLLFNTTTQAWSYAPTYGETPLPRMGHSATAVTEDLVLVYGGAGSNDTVISSTMYLLNTSIPGSWLWREIKPDNRSLATPARAWHTMTYTRDRTFVVAFGLDTLTGATSDELFFLSTDESYSRWQWTKTNPLATEVSPIEASVVQSPILLATSADDGPSPTDQMDPPLMQLFASSTASRLHNPKLDEQEPKGLPGGNDPNGHDSEDDSPAEATSARDDDDDSPTRTSTHAKTRTTTSRLSDATAAKNEADGSSSSSAASNSSKTGVIAGSVSAIFLLALVAGAIGLYARRRAAKENSTTPLTGDAMVDRGTLPPISQMLYTRQAPRRMLSLGSATSSNRSSSVSSNGSSNGGGGRRKAGGGRAGRAGASRDTFEPISESEARGAVGEFGQYPSHVPRKPSAAAMSSRSSASSASRSPTVRPTQADLMVPTSDTPASVSSVGHASVASYPFLTSLPIFGTPSLSAHHEGTEEAIDMAEDSGTRQEDPFADVNGVSDPVVLRDVMEVPMILRPGSAMRR